MPRIRSQKITLISKQKLSLNPYAKFCPGDLGWTMYEAEAPFAQAHSWSSAFSLKVLLLHRYHLEHFVMFLYCTKVDIVGTYILGSL